MEKHNKLKLDEFRKKVLSKMSTFFCDVKDVKLAVLESIPKIESEYELQGWVRYEIIPDTKALADEIAKLHTENIKLREANTKLTDEINKIRNKNNSDDSNVEFDEVIEILSEKEIDIKGIKSYIPKTIEVSDKVNALTLAFVFRDVLMQGVTNKLGIDEITSFIFFCLCPQLQVHDLVTNEKVPGVLYRRYAITKKGLKFFSYIDKKLHQKSKDKKEYHSKEITIKKITKKATKKNG